jgi:hypothetical protein
MCQLKCYMLCQVLFHKLCSALSYMLYHMLCHMLCTCWAEPQIVSCHSCAVLHVKPHLNCDPHYFVYCATYVLCHICIMPGVVLRIIKHVFLWRYAPAFVPNVTPRNVPRVVPHVRPAFVPNVMPRNNSVPRVVPGEHLAVEEAVVRLCSFLLVRSADLRTENHLESDLSKTSKISLTVRFLVMCLQVWWWYDD